MESVIKGACNHGQAGSGLFVERPETEIVAMQVLMQSIHRAREERSHHAVPCSKKKVVNTPRRPQETVQDMSRGRDDVLFKPDIPSLVGETDAAFVSLPQKTTKSASGSLQIFLLMGFFVCTNEQRDSLPLRQARIPGRDQATTVLPIEKMIPHRDTEGIRFQSHAQPLCSCEKFSPPSLVACP